MDKKQTLNGQETGTQEQEPRGESGHLSRRNFLTLLGGASAAAALTTVPTANLTGGDAEAAELSAARVQVNPRPWEWRHEDGSMKLVIVTQSESSDELGISPT
jgi:hypothetical protein